MRSDQWRPLIDATLQALWPDLPNGTRWITAQVEVESGGSPTAVSPAGALGLMQLMPATALEVGVTNPLDPGENVHGGVTYLRRQYDRLDMVPDATQRLLWAFAAYNGGLGYVLRAHTLSRLDKQPLWWRWDPGRYYLMHRQCRVGEKFPLYLDIWTYVERIQRLVV